MATLLVEFMHIEAVTNAQHRTPSVRGEASRTSLHATIEANSTKNAKLNAGHVGVSIDSAGRSTLSVRSRPEQTNDYHESNLPVTVRPAKKARTAAPSMLKAEGLRPVYGEAPLRPNSTTNRSSPVPSRYEAQPLTPTVAFFTYTACVMLTVGVTVGIYSERGFSSVIIILTYIISLSSMTLTIRGLFAGTTFDFPWWVSASHFINTFIVGFFILLHRWAREATPIVVPTPRQFLCNILPVALALAASTGFANLALLHANVHFYEMVGAMTPFASASLETFLRNAFSLRLVPPSLLIMFGLTVCALYEVTLSWLGFNFCCIAMLFRALKSTVQTVSLNSEAHKIHLAPLELLVWTSLSCALIMASWSLVQEGTEPYAMMLEKKVAVLLLLTILNACILNISALCALHDLVPFAQQIVVQLKGILAILGSVWLFNEMTAVNQLVGYTCMLIGIFWYNRREHAMKMQPGIADTRNGQTENLPAG